MTYPSLGTRLMVDSPFYICCMHTRGLQVLSPIPRPTCHRTYLPSLACYSMPLVLLTARFDPLSIRWVHWAGKQSYDMIRAWSDAFEWRFLPPIYNTGNTDLDMAEATAVAPAKQLRHPTGHLLSTLALPTTGILSTVFTEVMQSISQPIAALALRSPHFLRSVQLLESSGLA
jgi:hypothetical protein